MAQESDSPVQTVGHGVGSTYGIHHGGMVGYRFILVDDKAGSDSGAVCFRNTERPGTAVGALIDRHGVVPHAEVHWPHVHTVAHAAFWR